MAWSTECRRYKIPSIQVCDAQSVPYTVSHPIIGSQGSPIFGPWLLHITGEASSAALISGFLDFTNQTKEAFSMKPHTQSFNNRVYQFHKHYFDNLLSLFCKFQNTLNFKHCNKNYFIFRFFFVNERNRKRILRDKRKRIGNGNIYKKFLIKQKILSLKPKLKKIRFIKEPRKVKKPFKFVKLIRKVQKVLRRKQQKAIKVTKLLIHTKKRFKKKPRKMTRLLIRTKKRFNKKPLRIRTTVQKIRGVVANISNTRQKMHPNPNKRKGYGKRLINSFRRYLLRKRLQKPLRYSLSSFRRYHLYKEKLRVKIRVLIDNLQAKKKWRSRLKYRKSFFRRNNNRRKKGVPSKIRKKQDKIKTFFFTKKIKIVRKYKNKTNERSKLEIYNNKLKVALYKTKKKLIETLFITTPLRFLRPVILTKIFTNRGRTGRTRKANYFNFSESEKTKKTVINTLYKVRDMKNYIFFQYNINKKPLLLATRKLLRINKLNLKYNKQFVYKISEYFNRFKDRRNLTFLVIKSLFWRQFIINIKKVYLQLLKLKALFGRKYFFKHFKRFFFLIIHYYKTVLVHCLGLRKALRRKRKQKCRYLTNITFHPRDLKTKFIVSFINLKFNYLLIKRKPLLQLKKLKKTQKLRQMEQVLLTNLPRSDITLIHGLVTYILCRVVKTAQTSYLQQYKKFFGNTLKNLPTKEYKALLKDKGSFHGKDLAFLQQLKTKLRALKHIKNVPPFARYIKSILAFPRTKNHQLTHRKRKRKHPRRRTSRLVYTSPTRKNNFF